jgi:hypothetical protein
MTLNEFYMCLTQNIHEVNVLSETLVYLYLKDKEDRLYCPITYVALRKTRTFFRLDQVYLALDLLELERSQEVLDAIRGEEGEIRSELLKILGYKKDPLRNLLPHKT